MAKRLGAVWLCLLIVVSLGSMAIGLAQAADSAGIERVRFRQFSVDKGLSQGSARAIVQDHDGFIWIGTQDGLNRFDGYEFRVYFRGQFGVAGLPDNHITALAVGREPGIWVGTHNGGLALFDPYGGEVRVWPAGSPERGELAGVSVQALLAHRWGGLWIAAGRAKLQYLADANAPLIDLTADPAIQLGEIRALREAADGAVYVAASTGVWRIADPDSSPVRVHPVELDARDVAESFDGSLWVATDADGVWRIDAEGVAKRVLHLAEGLPDATMRTLRFDHSGRLWIGSLAGLSRWQLDSRRLEVWRGDSRGDWDALSSPRVESLYEDRDGLLWIGTWFNGVNLHDPRSEAIAVVRPDPGRPRSLPARAVVGVAEARQGGLWMALSELNQVVDFDLDQGLVEVLELPRAEGSEEAAGLVRGLAEDASGSLWIALGGRGLARRQPNGQVTLLSPGGDMAVPKGQTFAVAVDAQGTLWVGSIGGGLSSLCAGCTAFRSYGDLPGWPRGGPAQDVLAVGPVADGSLWVGTRHSGALRLLADRSAFEHYPADSVSPTGLAHPFVTAFHEDRNGVLWMGTQGGGVQRVSRDASGRATSFQRFDRARGLATEAVGGIREDDQGHIWLSTTAGLSRIDPRSGSVLNFGEHEGALPGGYFIGSVARLADGRIVFGGPRGLTLFDPLDVQPPPPPRAIAISAIRVLGGVADAPSSATVRRWERGSSGGDQLILAPGADDFTLEMSALTFASPDQLQFEFRLEPFEPWRRVDAKRRFASYSNVPPGQYLFQARALRPNGEAGELMSLRVEVPSDAAPLERIGLLAVVASLLLGGLLLWLLIQRQHEQRLARQQVADSEARLKLALWGTGDEMWEYDLRSNRLHRENPLLHVRASSEEMLEDAGTLSRHVHPEDQILFRAAMARVIDGDHDVLDVTARVERLGGGYVWLRLRGRVAERGPGGRALRINGTTADITELKESAAAIEEANRELEHRVEERTAALTGANRELADALADLRRAQRQLVEQEKMAALGGLVAGVAHEINTPIGIGVTAASHLEACTRDFVRRFGEGRLTRGELQAFAEVAGESADLILRNLHRADRLIRSFKQVAVDQGSEDRRRIDLAHYVEEILIAWHPRLRRSGHAVRCEIAAGLQIDTLPGAIYQVLSNLIQNALLHAFEGRDGGGSIRIAARTEGDRLLIEFEDDGQGMDEAVRARVFEPFFTTRRGSGGSGLGLHIVYNLVTQALGGRIECHSVRGEGVRFLIDLPCAEPGEGNVAASPQPSSG